MLFIYNTSVNGETQQQKVMLLALATQQLSVTALMLLCSELAICKFRGHFSQHLYYHITLY